MKYIVVGAAGYIAERHVKAIHTIGGEVVSICDIHSSVGYIDKYFPQCKFYSDVTDCFRNSVADYVVICTPNHYHLYHCLHAIEHGFKVICEKPLVLGVANLNALRLHEDKINTILQLRYHPDIFALKYSLPAFAQVNVKYHAPRGDWYDRSWKGNQTASGGILFNIGIHLFDLLCWLWGEPNEIEYDQLDVRNTNGRFVYPNAEVNWELSTDIKNEGVRDFEVNGNKLCLSSYFEELHTISHEEIANDRGFGISDVEPSIQLIERLLDVKNR